MPKVNAPDTGKEVQSYADPILRVNIWVPNYVTTLEMPPDSKMIGVIGANGDFSEYYFKKESSTNTSKRRLLYCNLCLWFL
jgi:hypothetical protein